MVIIILILLISIVLVVLFGLFVNKRQEETRIYASESVWPENINDIPVITAIIPEGSTRRTLQTREIMWIVVHETDNRKFGTDAAQHSLFLTTNNQTITGWHYTVDDHEIYHNLPDNEVSWHAGDKKTEFGGNMNGVAIEMCVNADGDFDQTIDNTAQLVAYLMDAYDLTIDDVKLHQDFSGKTCPHRLITENKVGMFYELVQKYYDEIQAEKAKESSSEK